MCLWPRSAGFTTASSAAASGAGEDRPHSTRECAVKSASQGDYTYDTYGHDRCSAHLCGTGYWNILLPLMLCVNILGVFSIFKNGLVQL